MKFMLGIDEAGRGPLAGPVAVGVVAVPQTFAISREFPGLVDSKQMPPPERIKLYRQMRRRMKDGDIRLCVRYASPAQIDEWGLTKAVIYAAQRGIRFVAPEPKGVFVYLDGLLSVPEEYHQQTIVGGDEAVPVIALASIAAKVLRDRVMTRLAKQFPQYGFEIHKGYGTKAHYEALKKYGPCAIHRQSFLHEEEED